jgi:hypothetical protein
VKFRSSRTSNENNSSVVSGIEKLGMIVKSSQSKTQISPSAPAARPKVPEE